MSRLAARPGARGGASDYERVRELEYTGCSSAWSERPLWEREVSAVRVRPPRPSVRLRAARRSLDRAHDMTIRADELAFLELFEDQLAVVMPQHRSDLGDLPGAR